MSFWFWFWAEAEYWRGPCFCFCSVWWSCNRRCWVNHSDASTGEFYWAWMCKFIFIWSDGWGLEYRPGDRAMCQLRFLHQFLIRGQWLQRHGTALLQEPWRSRARGWELWSDRLGSVRGYYESFCWFDFLFCSHDSSLYLMSQSSRCENSVCMQQKRHWILVKCFSMFICKKCVNHCVIVWVTIFCCIYLIFSYTTTKWRRSNEKTSLDTLKSSIRAWEKNSVTLLLTSTNMSVESFLSFYVCTYARLLVKWIFFFNNISNVYVEFF